MDARDVLRGIMPAIVSPCDEDDRFMEDQFAAVAGHLYREGVNGLYVCGVSGDGYSMRLHERKRAAEIAIEQSRAYGGTVVVHLGTSNSRDSMELAEHAAEAGASAVASMPPAGRDLAQLVRYYKDIARASELPLLVYYIPAISGRTLSLNEMLRLLDIEGVIGVKFSDYNLFFMKRLLLSNPGMIVFNGNDEMLCPALLYGACGGIGQTYNLFPRLFVAMYRAVLEGDIARGMSLQNHLCGFLDGAFGLGVAAVVEHVMRTRGFGPFCYRRPRTLLSPEDVETFERNFALHEATIDEACEDAYAGVERDYGIRNR